MTTIAELLALPAVESAANRELADVFERFVLRYDRGLAEAAGGRLGFDEWFMGRVAFRIVLKTSNVRYGQLLGRLEFDGVPLALIRCEARDWDADPDDGAFAEQIVRLTDRAAADRLVDACHARLAEMGNASDRLDEAGGADAAGDLLDFGPAAEVDVRNQRVVVRRQERLLTLSSGPRLAALKAVAGGTFVVAPLGEPGSSRACDTAEDAAEAFGAILASVAGHGTGQNIPVFLHRRSDGSAVGLVGNRSLCTAVEGRSRSSVEARDDLAVPTFLTLADQMVRKALDLPAAIPSP